VTTISNTADLLRLLRENPDFRDEVRRLLLSQELIELPERFARFEAYVERQFTEVRSDIARVDGDITEMRSNIIHRGEVTEIRGEVTEIRGEVTEIRGEVTEIRGEVTEIRGEVTEIRGEVTEIRGEVAELRGEVTEIHGDLGRLKGGEYERRVGRMFASYASGAFRQRHNRPLRRNRLLVGASQVPTAEYQDILANAVENGEISVAEMDDLQEADAVMRGQDQGSAVYFVGEFSVTVNNHDIDRAISRASILSKATGSQTWPLVIGATIPDPQRARAEAGGVALRQVAE
jgi:hypothetical protein